MNKDEKKEEMKRLVHQLTEKERESFAIRKELADDPKREGELIERLKKKEKEGNYILEEMKKIAEKEEEKE